MSPVKRPIHEESKQKELILSLTTLWQSCLIDHHKDRDCHFRIITEYSYGNPPVYAAEHYGYVADKWHSGPFATYTQAEEFLIQKLKSMIETEAKAWLSKTKEDWGEEADLHRSHFEKVLKKFETVI